MNRSMFESFLHFLSNPVSKTKKSKWSFISKLMQKGVIACEEKQESGNELECVDAALAEVSKFNRALFSQTKLEALETSIEHLEIGLESVFRGLIKPSASLLNMTHSNCLAVRKGIDFLLQIQCEDGGSGESYLSCSNKVYTPLEGN
ncbi:hypothetical protein K2173_023431 [Erythroxylum novogranatense]|uniref:Uncharacterized protein n=1 Tax=Erythroxylum novogranatense TaxID=1862640 RepID=A0AAV8TX41_9ROSI|nr:hypothetical protein K2173_023431 [Erythroxylum novogranatense]